MNAAGQLKTISAGSTTTSYTYDGDNHRVGTTAGRTNTTSSYDPLNRALALEQEGTKALRRYDYGLGLLSMTSGTTTSSYLTDALGFVRGVTSPTGALSSSYSYHPYGDTGATTTGKNAPRTRSNSPAPMGAVRSTNMGARDYSPANGRFLSPGPTRIPGRGFTYAGANPMTDIDPSGLSDCAQRLLPLFERYSRVMAEPTQGLRLADILSTGWDAASGRVVDDLHQMESEAESLVPSEEPEWVLETGYAENAAAAVAYAARVFLKDDAQESAWAARQLYDRLRLLAGQPKGRLQ